MYPIKKIYFLVLVGFINFCYSQRPEVHIPQINEPIVLDGNIDEVQWQNAYLMNNFKQFTPSLGANATERPIFYVLYDQDYIYVGATIKYNEPSEMFARVLERDVSLNRDDYIEIHIDSYNDHTNSLVFSTNLLGARYDYEVSRNGEEINDSWNAFWDVSTSIVENGWSAEFRIPFTSLKYVQRSENTMRIKAVVKYKNKNELILSPLNDTERQPVIYQYKNAEEIVFKDLPKATPLFITPYVKGGILTENMLNSEGSAFEGSTQILEEKGFSSNKGLDKFLSNVGLDIRYKPNPNQTLNVTLNTDFAQVEADDKIVNTTRFPIFLTEKRLFFLENADLFNSNQFDHRLFHSRRIGIDEGKAVPIIGGVNFAGDTRKWQFGALSMQTNKAEDLPSENLSVLRLKRKIGSKGSYIGIIGTGKISNNDYNYLTALDANIRIKDNVQTQFTIASTFDKEEGNWKPMYGASINTFQSNGFGIEYRFREYTENFNPELGFLSRPDTKRVTLNHGWRKTYTNHSFLQRLSLGNWLTRYWIASNGKPEFFQTNIYFFVDFTSGHEFGMFAPMYQTDHLFVPWNFAENVSIPQGNYANWKAQPSFSTGNAYPYTLSGELEFGEFYGGKQTTVIGTFSYDFSKTFQAEIGTTINRFRFPDSYVLQGGNRVKADLHFSRLKLAFSSSSFLNSLIQFDTSENKVGWNIRYRYTPKEGTNLYVVYNHNINNDRTRVSPELPFTENVGFTIKFSQTFF